MAEKYNIRDTEVYKNTFNMTIVQLMDGIPVEMFEFIKEQLLEEEQYEGIVAIDTAIEQFKHWDGKTKVGTSLY